MNIKYKLVQLLSTLFIIGIGQSVQSCSMYKITVNDTTMVGCNHDAWRTTASIWFINARSNSEYGVCITGSRKVGPNQFAPQSGMNEEGLVFSRLTAYHPIRDLKSGKRQITNEVDYLTEILQKCKTVEDVRNFIEQYDYSIFIDEVFIYIDRSGDYLIVEPYQMIEGNEPSYVLANFCPSLTSNENARRQNRYKNGEDYLSANSLNTSLEYCRSVSDTMSVCRNRNGDGTLLTSIWDTENGLVNLYFYHEYDNTIQFNISKELAKGNQLISLPELFPDNPEFERLKNYKTPFNTPLLRVSLALIGGFIILLSLLFLISFLKNRNRHRFDMVRLFVAGINFLLFPYLFILATNINIFYFDAPYHHQGSNLISLSSYIPVFLLLFILPIMCYTYLFFGSKERSHWIKGSLIINNVLFVLLIVGFGYWGLFNVFN